MTEQLIEKNSLKYRGLNVKAPEFFPEVRKHILKSNFIKEATRISMERKKQGLIISKAINKELPKVNIEQGEIKFDFTYKEEKQY